MRIFVDPTEPGLILQDLFRRAAASGIAVERSLLHKREGLGPSARQEHPFYGLGADFVITDAARVPLAAIERKTLEDLAKSAGIIDHRVEGGTKLGIQLWCAGEGIAVIYSTGPLATSRCVLSLARRLSRETTNVEVEEYVRALALDGGAHPGAGLRRHR